MRPLHEPHEMAEEEAAAVALLRSISVAPQLGVDAWGKPAPTLVALTQRRVREHAERLHEAQVRQWGLAVSSVIAGAMTLSSSVSVWHVLADFGWLTAPWIWAPVLLGVWFLPGVLAGAAWVGMRERKGAVTQ